MKLYLVLSIPLWINLNNHNIMLIKLKLSIPLWINYDFGNYEYREIVVTFNSIVD